MDIVQLDIQIFLPFFLRDSFRFSQDEQKRRLSESGISGIMEKAPADPIGNPRGLLLIRRKKESVI